MQTSFKSIEIRCSGRLYCHLSPEYIDFSQRQHVFTRKYSMALYTILFGLSIFLIALVMAIIKNMFFHWKEEHAIERMVTATIERPGWYAFHFICVKSNKNNTIRYLLYYTGSLVR